MSESRPTGWEGAERWFSSEGGGEGAPETPPTPPPPACEVCGAELEPDQTYCLECGSPTPLAPRLRRGGRTVAVLAGAMIVLGLGAGALAYAVVDDDGTVTVTGPATFSSPGEIPLPSTGSIPVVPLPPETAPTTGTLPADTSVTTPTAPGLTTGPPGTTGFDTVTGPSTAPTTTEAPTTKAAPTTASPPATTDAAPSNDSDWPSGTSAWTAVLSSVRSETDARAAKGRVAKEGDPAGVLFSSDFPDLRPGYWVVFSGMYDSRNTAIAQAVKLRPDFPTAYARRIEG